MVDRIFSTFAFSYDAKRKKNILLPKTKHLIRLDVSISQIGCDKQVKLVLLICISIKAGKDIRT